MATAPSPNDLTRQQLDELDALLQKMLSAPLAPVDTPPPVATLPPLPAPPLPPSWRAEPPATYVPPAAERPLPPAERPRTEPSFVPHVPPVAERPRSDAGAGLSPPLPVPKAPPAPTPKAATSPAPAPTAPVTPAPDAPPVPLALLPLVALNGLFDGICGLFGPPGRLLCSGFFKHLYGIAGLGLLGYTALRVAQVQGWLSLPLPLPWPK